MGLYLCKPGNWNCYTNLIGWRISQGGQIKGSCRDGLRVRHSQRSWKTKSKNRKSNRPNKNHNLLLSSQTWANLETFDWKLTVLLEERTLPFLDPSPMGPAAICLWDVILEKSNTHTFQGLLNIGSELTLISGNPKHHYVFSVEVGLLITRNKWIPR